jgi:hypothetical protein
LAHDEWCNCGRWRCYCGCRARSRTYCLDRAITCWPHYKRGDEMRSLFYAAQTNLSSESSFHSELIVHRNILRRISYISRCFSSRPSQASTVPPRTRSTQGMPLVESSLVRHFSSLFHHNYQSLKVCTWKSFVLSVTKTKKSLNFQIASYPPDRSSTFACSYTNPQAQSQYFPHGHNTTLNQLLPYNAPLPFTHTPASQKKKD